MNKIIASLLLCLSWANSAQTQDLGLYFMDGIWQKSLVVPSHDLEGKHWSIGITGGSLYLYNRGPGITDIGTINDGVLLLSPSKALQYVSPRNDIAADYTYETFHISYKYKENLIFSLNHSSHNTMELRYPGDLMRLMAYGNGAYLNEELQLGVGVNYSSYGELGFGAIYKMGGVDLGARIGFLFGRLNFQTRHSDLSLYTAEDYYQLRFKGNYEMNTSGFPGVDGITSFNTGQLFRSVFPAGFSNPGVSLSIGATYHPSEVLSLQLSVKDWGFIHWGKLPRTYRVEGEWEYSGIDIFNVGGQLDTSSLKNLSPDDIQGWVDTLSQLLNLDGPDKSSYNTALPTKIALSGSYRLTDKFTVGALYRYVNGVLTSDHQMAIDATYNFWGFWRVGAMYSLYHGKQNIGLHSNFNLGPVQIYLATDKVFSIGRSNKHYRQVRGGINIAF